MVINASERYISMRAPLQIKRKTTEKKKHEQSDQQEPSARNCLTLYAMK